jgi:hypothetical protein
MTARTSPQLPHSNLFNDYHSFPTPPSVLHSHNSVRTFLHSPDHHSPDAPFSPPSPLHQPPDFPTQSESSIPFPNFQPPISSDLFTFIINGVSFHTDCSEAIFLSPAVSEQLSVDACSRIFTISDDDIFSSDFTSLRTFLSGAPFTFDRSAFTSLISLCQRLSNLSLEQFFFELSASSLSDDISLTFPDLFHPQLDQSIPLNFLSNSVPISLESLDNLLSRNHLIIDSEDTLLEWLLSLPSDYFPLLRHIQFSFVSDQFLGHFIDYFGVLPPPEPLWKGVSIWVKNAMHPAGVLKSLILSNLPAMFDQIRTKRFYLLWRGSQDGFGVRDFHSRCDGHPNTLTLILDTDGNVFGGYTPVEWESPVSWRCKCDDREKSFLFTLKNPHNTAARRFPLKSGCKERAIYCDATRGPAFGSPGDIRIHDNCNANTDSFSDLGNTYLNDTRVNGKVAFTGGLHFTVEEIEVFEISD